MSCCRRTRRCTIWCRKCVCTCFRPQEEDLVEELIALAKENKSNEIATLHGRARFRFGEEYETGALCCRIPERAREEGWREASALHFAALGDHLESILVILKLPGCDPTVRDEPCQRTALHFACMENHIAMVHLLLKYKCPINARDWKKNTALIHAASSGSNGAVKALADNGADLDCRNRGGLTALLAALIHGRRDCALTLIKLGASLEISDSHGNTPLHVACVRGDRQAVKFLIQCGANVMVFNKFNSSPLDEARRCKRQKVLWLIEEAWSAARVALGLSPGLGDKRKSTKELEGRDGLRAGGRQGISDAREGEEGGGERVEEDVAVRLNFSRREEKEEEKEGDRISEKPLLPMVVGGGKDHFNSLT